ncbi:branched-chain amino acid transport system II carrier protein [Pseudoflavonifractor phocaeensis]|uniref:branched-chain amino acid transport system II carrier protein n=1 Tax=Pseudoflavonifractor phocaeensis TaxID=1870988 RepID=UPI00195A1362|nr:branched-chain amino acid transport system II carrier protein [Pseudoflavonifractor phocaeensis]
MKRLCGKDGLLVGFTLFSMFFGAGNLIFPPGIAAQAGTMTWFAVLGLAISAVGLPVLGVVAVARAGGMDQLGLRVHPAFAKVFTVVAYLAIGPCLAIPRTASTSFEMAVPPFVSADAPIWLFQLLYSVVFFALALLVALRPEKLTDRLGKIMCPILVLLIVITFAACLLNPLQGYGPPSERWDTPIKAISAGFLDGYQTMDTIAALAFGIIIALNIRARGVTEDKAVVGGTVRAGLIAGGMLLVIYSMLAHIGGISGGAVPNPSDGTQALTNIIPLLFGPAGSILLAAIFVIACFNVCVGLISSCGEFFYGLCPKLSYRGWAVLFAVVSMVLANAGLTQILTFSIPVLNIIYPVAIVLILLSFAHSWLQYAPAVYPAAILCTGVASVLLEIERLTNAAFLSFLPLSDLGLGWVTPALAGAVVGLLWSAFSPKR